MVQNPESSEYDGMPRSAIASVTVDFVLPPAEMFAQLNTYLTHAFSRPTVNLFQSQQHNILKKVFILIRSKTGHDFSQYKTNSTYRRVHRRMAIQQLDTLEEYIKYLQLSPQEVEALFRDLLIGVTSFFRDPEAFKVLAEQIIPNLFAGKPAGSTIRVWSTGCSTGEEAYSLAILLIEHIETLKQNYVVQVFATDIDSQAIAKARTGFYPASIVGDLTPERLARFFIPESDGSAYRIHKNIRDVLIFSEQDVIKDPPFSKIDLLCCRNLLIYFNGDLQKKLIPLFHYALNPAGILFLGNSETVGECNDLFVPLDRKLKLYQRKESTAQAGRPLGRSFSSPVTTSMEALKTGLAHAGKSSWRELTEQTLMEHVFLAAVLVNRQGDIFYLHGRTGMYLELIPGDVSTLNILKIAREGLQHKLTTALHRAAGKKEIVRCPDLRVKTNGDFTTVNLTIQPVKAATTAGPTAETLYLVMLEDIPSSGLDVHSGPLSVSTDPLPDDDQRIAALKQELRDKEEYLHTSNEELATTTEELKSFNEEMQSVNEKMQSTNEELETSREELQSLNEELATVNTELQTKVTDLSRANNDMNNLLAGTGIATIFVDHQLRILRFTSAATQIINLILSDIGRPVGHIVSNLASYDRLLEDVQAVLNTLIPKELEVQTTKGRWFMMRILPYRTVDNVIEGAVLTFVDITELKELQQRMMEVYDDSRMATIVRDSNDAITMQDLDGSFLAWNKTAVRLYGWSEAEALKMNVRSLLPQGTIKEEVLRMLQLSKAEILAPYRSQRIAKDGTVVPVLITASALLNDAGTIYAIATTERPAQEEQENRNDQ